MQEEEAKMKSSELDRWMETVRNILTSEWACTAREAHLIAAQVRDEFDCGRSPQEAVEMFDWENFLQAEEE